MARASTATLLSLDRFARILGISPVHFNGGSGAAIWPRNGSCDETWVQHSWQTVRTISREELAREIKGSENEIARYLGWDTAPTWHIAEEYRWPAHYDRGVNGLHYDARGNQPSLPLARSKIISGGQRAWTYIDNGAAVVYSDEDSDGYDETATITAATTLTDVSEIKLYVEAASQPGWPTWEVRPIRRKYISGGAVTIICDAWLLLDPALWEAYPTGTEMEDIDIDVAGNYLAIADVIREYNDIGETASELRWRSSCLLCGGSGCAACNPATQTGCMSIIDSRRGFVQPKPATYADGSWTAAQWDIATRPETIKFWYYAGDISQEYLAGFSNDPLSDYWAEAIAWLTAARLSRPLCSCQNVMAMVDRMQHDLLLNKRETGARFIPGDSQVHINPFGWRYGEVRAWGRVNEAMQERGGVI